MRIRCQQCGLDMDVPPRTEGSRLRCPECQFEFICALPRAVEVDQPPAAGGEEIVLAEEADAAARPADEALAEMHADAGDPEKEPDAPQPAHCMTPSGSMQ